MSGGPTFVELPPATLPDVGGRPAGPSPTDVETGAGASASRSTTGSPAAGAASPDAADAPAYRGYFPFASTSLRGLSAPFWCLFAYLFVQTTMIDEEWPAIGRFRPRLVLGGLALAVTAIRWVSRPFARGTRAPEHLATSLWLLAFVLVGAFSAMWAFEPGVAQDTQIEMTTTMLVYFLLLAIVRTKREVALTVLVLAAGSGLYLVRSFSEWLAGKYVYTMGVVRMMGAGTSVSDPNSFAGTIAFSLPILIWCAVRASVPRGAPTSAVLARVSLRISLTIYGLLAVYCAISTHSRSGLVLLILNMLFTLVMLPNKKAKFAMLFLLAGMVAWLFAGQSDEAIKRYASIANKDTYSKESSTAERVKNYGIAWRMMQDNTALGVGPGCWSIYRTRRVDGDPLMPHSLTGQVVATYGALGTITFVGYLGAVFLFAWRALRRRWDSVDPWDRAVRSLAGTVAFTILLLLVSGLGAHNVDRLAWYLLPGLLAAATSAKQSGDPPPKASRGAAEALA